MVNDGVMNDGVRVKCQSKLVPEYQKHSNLLWHLTLTPCYGDLWLTFLPSLQNPPLNSMVGGQFLLLFSWHLWDTP